jgi:hypothetical protein
MADTDGRPPSAADALGTALLAGHAPMQTGACDHYKRGARLSDGRLDRARTGNVLKLGGHFR